MAMDIEAIRKLLKLTDEELPTIHSSPAPAAPPVYLPNRPPKPNRCGAKTRKGTPCQCKGLGRGGRCKFHGGMSTGPRTPEGRARIAESNRRRARVIANDEARRERVAGVSEQ